MRAWYGQINQLRWSRGDPIAWRTRVRTAADRPLGDLGVVFPARVVSDEADEVVIYIAPGSVGQIRAAEHGGPRDRVVLAIGDGFSEVLWKAHRLILRRPADEHAVSLFWDGVTWTFKFWYIDLQSRLQRTPSGFEVVDHGIDMVIEPDLSSWRWKDADELEWFVAHDRYTAAEAERIRAEGERAVANLQSHPERYLQWISWRPDPAWRPSPLPKGWDAP